MAQIVINEISQNYTYNIGTNSFATVALPITSCWGPAYMDHRLWGVSEQDMLDSTVWQRFSANKAGLEAFVSTFRGPASNYRAIEDYSYQMAMTLLTSGYDILVCRLCPGIPAEGCYIHRLSDETGDGYIAPGEDEYGDEDNLVGNRLLLQAKYMGTFGNSLRVKLRKIATTVKPCWNMVVYVEDSAGVLTSIENLMFCFERKNATDSVPHISEVNSNFLKFKLVPDIHDYDDEYDVLPSTKSESGDRFKLGAPGELLRLTGGTDAPSSEDIPYGDSAYNQALARYIDAGVVTVEESEGTTVVNDVSYTAALKPQSEPGLVQDANLYCKEWLYTSAYKVYDILKDKLSYNPQRIISPGWDDQNIVSITGEYLEYTDNDAVLSISPLHIKLMDVAYYSRCATALLDIPSCLPSKLVHDDSYTGQVVNGYAQKLARYVPNAAELDLNANLYPTHSALFAPWGKYIYTGTSKQNTASPAFLALMIQRAMILNQSVQYEWALPTNRKHKLRIGKLAYNVTKKLLDKWQNIEGVGVNAIADIPGQGIALWGNSTLFEVPPATYNALSNLSTRYLMNAVKDQSYRCGIAITFQYNNEQAYSAFYAGMTPLLDAMKNVGAIDNYSIKMSADIDGLDHVNANTVIGKIYLVINGVINDINIDLIAMPAGSVLD